MQESDDIAKQYQQILNQYASEINPPPSTSPSPQPSPIIPPTPPVSSPVMSPIPPSKPSGNFFKYFFIFSVFIFLSVVSALVYSILSSQQIINNKNGTPPVSSTTPTPTVSSQAATPAEGVCQLNDKNYGVGESFLAADGCNTCSCQTDLTITCTEKECEVQP